MENHELLANIAQDHYITQLSLAEIVEKYDLSRYLVNKYLEDAREEGIVTINIQTPLARDTGLERELGKAFDTTLFIIKDEEQENKENRHLVQFAANHIEAHIKDSHIIGTTWGGTMFDTIDRFTAEPMEHLLFTQFMGENRKYQSAAGSKRMVEKAAQKFSASYEALSGPLYIADEETRRGMLAEIASQHAISLASHMDMLFTGIGTMASINSISDWKGHTEEIFPDLDLKKIAGMVYGRPYDSRGRFLNRQHDHVFGVALDTVLATPTRIGVVRSKFKTSATLGALRGNFFTEMILSESVARRVLAEL